MIESLDAVNKFIREGGWLAVLLIVLASGFMGYWYFGPVVRQLLASKDDQIQALRHDLVEAVTGWRTQTDATRQLAAALEERNKIDRELRSGRP